MKILVTAFDPFGGETINPAQQSVERLETVIGEHTVHKLIVPTVFGGAAELVINTMNRLVPDAVVCIGQAGGRRCVTPERVASSLNLIFRSLQIFFIRKTIAFLICTCITSDKF